MAKNQELDEISLSINTMLAAKKKQLSLLQKKEAKDINHEKIPFWLNKVVVSEKPKFKMYFPAEIEKDENLYRAVLRSLLLMLAQRIAYHATTSLDEGSLVSAIKLFSATDGVMATYFSLLNSDGMSLQAARRALAKLGGQAKVATDPKQAEKSFIMECWQKWQKSPTTYRSKAAFAKDMLTKCEHLTNQKKIEDWCREWGKSHPAG